jgi:hypothetical protein
MNHTKSRQQKGFFAAICATISAAKAQWIPQRHAQLGITTTKSNATTDNT